jgi:hypothetical protein
MHEFLLALAVAIACQALDSFLSRWRFNFRSSLSFNPPTLNLTLQVKPHTSASGRRKSRRKRKRPARRNGSGNKRESIA